jgi:uncharacterized LabA/DUF88 family protein
MKDKFSQVTKGHPEQRVAIFVDVQNMFYSAKKQFRAKLNYTKLLEEAVAGRRLLRAFAYTVQTPEIDQKNFMEMLEYNGYEVRSKDLKVRPDGSTKGDWDMGIAIDAIAMSDKVDVIVLVSGDGDFSSLARMLRGRGARFEVMSFPASTADELKEAVDGFYPITPKMLLKD